MICPKCIFEWNHFASISDCDLCGYEVTDVTDIPEKHRAVINSGPSILKMRIIGAIPPSEV